MHSYLDEELVDGERLALESHLAGCSTCSKAAEVERHNLTLIRTRALEASPGAPESLKTRIHDGIHGGQRRGLQRRWLQVSAAAVSMAVIGAVGHQQWHVWQRQLFVEEAARRHARQLPLEMQGQPEVLEAWFGGKLDHRVTVPRFPNATTAGARLINVRDREAAYIRYDAPRANSSEPRHMGLFVFDDSGDLDLAALPSAEVGNSHGYNVVSWREGDVVYELVTDLDERDVRALVPHPETELRTSTPTPSHSLDVRPSSMTNQ